MFTLKCLILSIHKSWDVQEKYLLLKTPFQLYKLFAMQLKILIIYGALSVILVSYGYSTSIHGKVLETISGLPESIHLLLTDKGMTTTD